METKTLIIIYVLLVILTVVFVVRKNTHWSSIIGVVLMPIYFIWVIIDVFLLSRTSKIKSDTVVKGKYDMLVDVMVGICVHNPGILLEPPGNVNETAKQSLSVAFQNASLSSSAKTSYIITQGNMSFAESVKSASKELPVKIRQFMKQNDFYISAYDIQFFTEELRDDLKVLWAIAVRKT